MALGIWALVRDRRDGKVLGGIGAALAVVTLLVGWVDISDAVKMPAPATGTAKEALYKLPAAQPGLYYLTESGICYAGTDAKSGRLWLKGRFGSYALAPDGKVAVVNDQRRVTVITPAGQKSYDLPEAVRVTGWSPDSRYLLYVRFQEPVGSTLHRLDTTTGQVTDLTTGKDSSFRSAQYSPDGKQISFTQLSTLPGKQAVDWAVYVADADVRNPRLIGKGFDYTWSPDGQQLLVADTGPWTWYRADTGAVVRTGKGPGLSPLPLAWAPDNRVFYEYRDSIYLGNQALFSGKSPLWHGGQP